MRRRAARATAAAPRRGATWLPQALLYGLFATVIGVFSGWPSYEHLAPGRALIKLSLRHHGQRVADCRSLSAEELAKLPPNMRAPQQCPRERSPVTVEVDIDGAPALRHVAPPSGLKRDGASNIYRRLEVPAGPRRVAVRLDDDARRAGFDHVREATVTLAPAQVLVIDFDAEKGGIELE
jgi:hypothetical protein